ncbi:hypothetical protein QTG56_23885 (plasmid) [Rossellomorea sp. AcN35-11]|nr:hypothetical protein [Rossellomorea aquimaris]WJV32403.1 hypothetical protein QTG56_23885 [Rossellomorea sp. AcN35-11]
MKLKYTLIIVGVLLVSLTIYGLIKEILNPDVKENEVLVEQNASEFSNEIEKIKEFEEQRANGTISTEELKNFEKHLKEKYSTPESTIGYLFSLAMTKDTNNYSSAFINETFNKDIHKQADLTKLNGKIDLINEAMDKLTQTGTLEKIEYQDIQWTTDSKSVRVLTDLYYKGWKEPVRVNILLKTNEEYDLHTHSHNRTEEHNEEGSNSYYVASSVWDMISNIEKGATENDR